MYFGKGWCMFATYKKLFVSLFLCWMLFLFKKIEKHKASKSCAINCSERCLRLEKCISLKIVALISFRSTGFYRCNVYTTILSHDI